MPVTPAGREFTPMVLRSTAILFAVAVIAAPQSTTPSPPRFEVASVKPSGPKSVRGEGGGPGRKDPTHYRYQAATIEDLITTAYHVDYFQVASKAPIDRATFDVEANVPENATREEFRAMLRNLLEERFHLKAHVESREFAGYELVVAKSGLKIKESGAAAEAHEDSRRPPGDEGFPELPLGRPGLISRNTAINGVMLTRLRARQEPFSVLADVLHTPGEEPVVDKTGLTGKYDFTLEYGSEMSGAPRPGEPQTPVGASIFTALPQQLGLQLIAKKLPFDVVVVDSVDRAPTEN
jgi:uncharacterized protein (TIGR03435 family)